MKEIKGNLSIQPSRLSWSPHLNSRSVVIVWSREGFLISLIQLFPSPRSQRHSILDAPPPRFRFLFYCWRTSWLSDRTSPTVRTLLSLKTFPARWLCLLAWYRSDPSRSSNLIFIQRSPSSFPLLSVRLSPKISEDPSFLIRCLTITIGIYLDDDEMFEKFEKHLNLEYARTISSLFWFSLDWQFLVKEVEFSGRMICC